MKFPNLVIGQNAYLMVDYEFKQVEVKVISEDDSHRRWFECNNSAHWVFIQERNC